MSQILEQDIWPPRFTVKLTPEQEQEFLKQYFQKPYTDNALEELAKDLREKMSKKRVKQLGEDK